MSEGKRALVTGAAAGIGRALCKDLVKRGFSVVAVDRDAVEWARDKNTVETIRADLSDYMAIVQLAEALAAMPPVDLAIHNAGVSATGRFEQIPAEVYERLLTVNAEAPMMLASAMLRSHRYAPGAGLVFVSSLSFATGYPGAAVYAASKDAVAVYAKSTRRAYAKAGVHVTTVFPGPTRTDHAERHSPPGSRADKRMPPEDLARLIVDAAMARKAVLYPGAGPKAARIAGWLMPKTSARLMRRFLFDKLDRDVW